MYFAKLEKEQAKLKNRYTIWYDTQKVTLAVDEMYNSDMFDPQKLMEWGDKVKTIKTWNNFKAFFKKYY